MTDSKMPDHRRSSLTPEQRRGIIRTALIVGAIALGVFIFTILRRWS